MTERKRYRDVHPYREPARGEFGHDLSKVEVDRALAAYHEAWEAKADQVEVPRLSIRVYMKHGPVEYFTPWIDPTRSVRAISDEEHRVIDVLWRTLRDSAALKLPVASDRVRLIPSHDISSIEVVQHTEWIDEVELYEEDE